MKLLCIIYGLNYLDSMRLLLYPTTCRASTLKTSRDDLVVCERDGS